MRLSETNEEIGENSEENEINDIEAGKNNDVTIWYWSPQREVSSNARESLASWISQGHVALQTHRGGADDHGFYISFWPGKCDSFWDDKDQDDPNKCYKAVSHFHTRDQDDLLYRNKIPKPYYLYNLNVEVINLAFVKLHDEDMNSYKDWTYNYNCSDVVLKLLEYVDVNPYSALQQRHGWFSKAIFGSLVGSISFSYLNHIYLKMSSEIIDNYIKRRIFDPNMGEIMKVFDGDQRRIVYTQYLRQFDLSTRLVNSLKIRESILTHSVFNALVGAVTSSIFSYVLFLLSSRKADLSYKERSRFSLMNSLEIGVNSFFILTICSLGISMLSYLGYYRSYSDPVSIFARTISIQMAATYGFLTPKFLLKFTTDFKKVRTLEFIAFIGVIALLISPKYFYDSTTTPKYVKKITKTANDQKNSILINKKQSFFKKIYYYKKASLFIGGVGVGIFALWNSDKVGSFLNHITKNSIPKVGAAIDLN